LQLLLAFAFNILNEGTDDSHPPYQIALTIAPSTKDNLTIVQKIILVEAQGSEV
jgi:hypothetical protein